MRHSVRAAGRRLGATVTSFGQCARGSATAWNLTWLTGFAIMGGLAIDSTNAWRVQTMMASTADVAALASAWELPENYLEQPYISGGYNDVEDVAMQFAVKNLSENKHGSYFQRDDVYVGNWDPETRTFTWGEQFPVADAMPVNAVRVFMGRNDDNRNHLQTSLLRFIGFDRWDINVTATAVYGVPECYRNGFVGREGIDLASNTEIRTNICLHGQLVANVNNHIKWSNPKSLTTGYSPRGEFEIPDPSSHTDLDGNPVDMSDLIRQNLYPPMVDRIPSIGRAMLRGDLNYRHFLYPKPADGSDPLVLALPSNVSEITGTYELPPTTGWRPWLDGDTRLASLGTSGLAGLIALSSSGDTTQDGRTTTFHEVEQQGGQYLWPLDPPTLDPDTDGFTVVTPVPEFDAKTALPEHRIYFAESCKGGNEGLIKLTGVVRNITLVTNCRIDVTGDARIENSVLLSTAGSQSHNKKSVEISNGAQIGAKTACEWGGVRIYANGMITTPSSGNNDTTFRQWYGAHLVARSSVQFAGLSDSTKGLSILAGGEIKIASNAKIGALDTADDDTYPVGGCPADSVAQAFGPDAYVPSLVD